MKERLMPNALLLQLCVIKNILFNENRWEWVSLIKPVGLEVIGRRLF
jgi:hypothetical protein